jgi:Calcineurin-like phosphoesterase
VRTLVISDLHLGAGRGRPRLEEYDVREQLAAAIYGCDRLVLLGDIVELRELPLRDALAAASRVIPTLTAGLPAGAQVLLVPGNHDHQLLAPWLSRRRDAESIPPLEPQSPVDWSHDEPLARLAAMFPDRVQVQGFYPGVWLREDVYAHHGHYLDGVTTTPGFERLAAGAMSRMLKLPVAEARSVDDYERLLAPLYAWMFAVSEQGGSTAADAVDDDVPSPKGSAKVLRLVNDSRGISAHALKFGISGAVNLLERAGLGDLSGNLAGEALRRASLAAYGQVLASLKLTPTYSIFGHTHRAGPLPSDDASEWRTESGVRLFNSGCWVNEIAFLGTTPSLSPYRAGFAVELIDEQPPRLVNLLDRPADQLTN